MRPLPPVVRRERRRLLAGLATVAAASILGAGLTVGSASAAPVRAPAAIPGDRFSPAVVAMAATTLEARDAYVSSGSPETFHIYQDRLDDTASAVAVEFATDPTVVTDAWAAADLDDLTAVLAALTQLGNDYQYASSDPAVGFDCSGLTAFAWRRAGIELPNQSGSQIEASPRVDADQAAPGDLVQYPGHVMLYLGFGDAMVHAANEATNVELSQLPDRSLNWADPNG